MLTYRIWTYTQYRIERLVIVFATLDKNTINPIDNRKTEAQ